MEQDLKLRLDRVVRRHRWFALCARLSLVWLAAAAGGFAVALAQKQTDAVSPAALASLVLVTLVTSGLVLHRTWRGAVDYRSLARKIERRHPELKGLLLTAVQQPETGGYLQHRVLQEAIRRGGEADWRDLVPRPRLWAMQAAQLAAFALFLASCARLWVNLRQDDALGLAPALGVTVTPGDAEVEKGESLVVMAKFGGQLPPAVDLVMQADGEPARIVSLVKNLADPVYGASLPEVRRDFRYRLEYAGGRTRDFEVRVFEHPAVVRGDTDVTYPSYTGLPPRHTENTRRVSAVEGSRLDLVLQLNKPVKSARLVSRGAGPDGTRAEVPLQVLDGAVATLPQYLLERSESFDLHLVDADGRASKPSPPFVFEVLPNRRPELRVNLPRGDVSPSPIEEVEFAGTVFDDFGSPAYGLAYILEGREPVFVPIGSDLPGRERRAFNHLLKLEEARVKPNELISWYAWADDIGPDGQVRRTNGDMYFGEVRPFDEIFRQGSMPPAAPPPSGRGQPSPPPLLELQRRIVSSTWKLERGREDAGLAADAAVVLASQQQALAQATALAARPSTPARVALWKAVTDEMQRAITQLGQVARTPDALRPALAAEQAAYAALLKLRGLEFEVRRMPPGGGGGGPPPEQNLRNRPPLDLDLAEDENRFERPSLAAPAAPPANQDLQVMNRLAELARRQAAVNEQLRELQTRLQEARTEAQREEIERQLRRLQAEQQQMLADVDELRQRLDRPENQERLADEARQVQQARQDLQDSAEAAARGQLTQALAEGTRAQRQLQEANDRMRAAATTQLEEDLRELRAAARELARRQEELGGGLAAIDAGGPRRLDAEDPRSAAARVLAGQQQRLAEVVDRARDMNVRAEIPEPLLADRLEEALRGFARSDQAAARRLRGQLEGAQLLTEEWNRALGTASAAGSRPLDATLNLLREGETGAARTAEALAREGINQLRDDIDRAAGSILGDDTQVLRMVEAELRNAVEDLQEEAAGAGNPAHAGPASAAAGQPAGAQPGPRSPAAPAGRNGGPPQLAQGQPGQGGPPGGGLPSGQPGSGGAPGTPPPGQAPGETQLALDQPGRGNPSAPPAGGGQGRQPGPPIGGGAGQSGGGSTTSNSAPPRLEGNRQPGGGRDALDEGTLAGGQDRGPSGSARGAGARPVTGAPEDFTGWSDRLRDVEEVVDSPAWREQVATARERIRLLRQAARAGERPDWSQAGVAIESLVEVRNEVSLELARRTSKEPVAPIDKDPVQTRFNNSVGRYFENLGKEE